MSAAIIEKCCGSGLDFSNLSDNFTREHVFLFIKIFEVIM